MPEKASDIKELTDKMFNYALVAEESETPDYSWITTDYLTQLLHENCDYIRLVGFTPELTLPDETGILFSDKIMLNRIFSNLFSNILKYGEKQLPVSVHAQILEKYYIISLSNTVKQEHSDIVTGNNIGLQNVLQITQLLNGSLHVYQENETEYSTIFKIELRFPLK